MQRLKKALALVLICLMALSAVACGTTPSETTPADSTPAGTTPVETTPAEPVVTASQNPILGGDANGLYIDLRSAEIDSAKKVGIVEEADGIFYLPSFTNLSALKVALSDASASLFYGKDATSLTEAKNGDTVDLTAMTATDERGNACYRATLKVGATAKTYTFYVGGQIPTVFVTTEKGLTWIEKEKENRDKGSFALIYDADGALAYVDASDMNSELKVRGNGSMNLAKKSYQLKLSAKTPLFHMEEGKNWILIPNYDDQSLLRNSVIFTFAEKLGFATMEFQSVELYVDGEYRGVYLLTEKVEIQTNRVNITELEKLVEAANPNVNFDRLYPRGTSQVNGKYLKSYKYCATLSDPADITGGYLIELDNNYGKDEPSVFYTKDGSTWVVKSPEYTSEAQMIYISGLFADMVEAMNASDGYNSQGKHYSEYIDMESFALGYLVSEISKNWDAGSSSHYFYKDKDVDGVTGKIFMGPLWDCDNTLGNCNKADDAAKISELKTASRSIFKMLMQHDDFKAIVAEKFADAKAIALAMTAPGGDVDQFVKELGSSVAMDQSRWKTYDKSQWPLYGAIFNFIHYDTWSNVPGGMFTFRPVYSDGTDLTDATTIGYLKDWFIRRVNALEPLLAPKQ
ncbi:MAG: CotH kinase family protein [Clostridia bacterium]|nr:CotH kinase family protein [Clostridia bacterium]